jgi:tetratricopeptide (TPR) repeat protein
MNAQPRREKVAETVAIKYRAFLSYSHADNGWAKWLHARLEGFRIDKELVGRETLRGPVPATLRPIFRDREDFSGGHSLTDATIAAIDASAAVVVLCSPVAAGRPAVNEEVRLFRTRHPDRPVIPVMIDGKWPDNFPPALLFELDADGSVSDRPVTILGPDLREAADGKSLGLAKVVAGLTGLCPDDVYRRAERARRRQNRLRAVVGAVILALAVASGGAYWQSRMQKQTLDEIAALVNRYSLVTPAEAAVPGARAGLTQAITAIAEGSAADPRYAKALELLKAGNPVEAEPLLKAVADDKARRADKDAKDAAAAYRNLASITAVSEPARARAYYAEAARLDPSDVTGMLQNGWFQQQAGQLDAAQAAYARVIAMAEPGGADEALIWAQLGTGDIQIERGNLAGALATYQGAEIIAARLAKSDLDNADGQRDLSVSYERIGDVQFKQGGLAAAFTSYRNSLAIRNRLAKSDAGNPLWQRDLSVAHEKVGDVLREQGDFGGAIASYRESRAVRDRLAKSDPSNTLWQRDLSVADNKIGDVQAAQGDLAGALTSYRASLAIRDRLAKSDPGNASWQRDLSVSYDRVGDLLKAQGDLAGALAPYRDGVAMRERLAKSDPSNASWQRDLSVSYEKVGDALKAQGDLAGAMNFYRDCLAIRERLAKSDPSNAEWQRDLSMSNERVGDVQVKQGDLAGAEKSYGDSLAIQYRLAKSDTGNALWERDLAISFDNVGDLQVRQGDLAGALTSYRNGLAIRQALVAKGNRNVQSQNDLQFSIGRMGDLAFTFILARDFDNALQSADQAIAIAPDQVWLYANRAHILMFLGREDEARVLYLRYRDEKNVLGKPWSTVILDDIAEMRKAGLINPLMDEITECLLVSGSQTGACTR